MIGWRYTTNIDETERYGAQGWLVSLTNRQAFTQTLAYDAEGRLATVTDPGGWTDPAPMLAISRTSPTMQRAISSPSPTLWAT